LRRSQEGLGKLRGASKRLRSTWEETRESKNGYIDFVIRMKGR